MKFMMWRGQEVVGLTEYGLILPSLIVEGSELHVYINFSTKFSISVFKGTYEGISMLCKDSLLFSFP